MINICGTQRWYMGNKIIRESVVSGRGRFPEGFQKRRLL